MLAPAGMTPKEVDKAKTLAWVLGKVPQKKPGTGSVPLAYTKAAFGAMCTTRGVNVYVRVSWQTCEKVGCCLGIFRRCNYVEHSEDVKCSLPDVMTGEENDVYQMSEGPDPIDPSVAQDCMDQAKEDACP
jgi:hypothetical protein